jgi:hypothetical protein
MVLVDTFVQWIALHFGVLIELYCLPVALGEHSSKSLRGKMILRESRASRRLIICASFIGKVKDPE